MEDHLIIMHNMITIIPEKIIVIIVIPMLITAMMIMTTPMIPAFSPMTRKAMKMMTTIHPHPTTPQKKTKKHT
eukprot:2458104-Ditylum_brightwellii.AAC.1